MKKRMLVCLLMMLLAVFSVAAAEETRIPVAENDRLALSLSVDLCGFEVLDKQTGVTWSSSMNDPTFTGKLAGLNQKKANSLLTVNVTNLVKGAGSITNAVLLNESQLGASYDLVENGVILHYDLATTGVALDVEVLLEDESVLVRVPYERINCYADFSIVSIDMMPYLCAGSDNADGFLFYPDGCGAILKFDDYAHFKELSQYFSIYGNVEKSQQMLDFYDQKQPTVMMPVYGISIGGNAMLAVVEEGAESTRISVSPSTKIVAVNTVCANFQYRRGFDDMRVTSRSIKTYDKNAMPVERSVGKNSDLTALAQKAAELGSTLSLTANFVEADTDTRSYSKRNDVVYLSNYAILTDPDEETFILSPEVIREKYEAFAKEAEKLSVSGLRLERVGQYIPFNYNRGHVWTTEQTLEAYQQMLADARASLGEVSVQGGAIWAAPYADLLTEVPYKDSGFQFTTEAVPFYQLVMHGVRAYTATPGNLSSDLDREMLRWVEMGYMPYFELTWSSTEELMYTDYQSLFTAQYSAWLDKVSAIAADFADGDLHNLRTALMMEHTKISSDLIRVRYDNGMQVYVNYADHDQQADGLTIPAMGYLVTKEGAQ